MKLIILKPIFVLELLFTAVFLSVAQGQYSGPQSGQTVAFFGDSITALGWTRPFGYIHLVSQALAMEGKQIVVVEAGANGNTSKDLLARLDADVLSKKPDWMVLSCGINDVWFGPDGVPLDQYQQNIRSIVDRALKANVNVLLLTSTMISEDDNAPNNQKLQPYNDFLRSFATEKNLSIVDLNKAMHDEIAKIKTANPACTGNLLTTDGVHMNGLGDQMMASGILTMWGVSDADLTKARAAWSELPNAMVLEPPTLNVREYQQLQASAAQFNCSVDELVDINLKRTIQTLLDTDGRQHPDPVAPPKHGPTH